MIVIWAKFCFICGMDLEAVANWSETSCGVGKGRWTVEGTDAARNSGARELDRKATATWG